MFKKKFKLSGSHQISNKDKKKLKEALLKMTYNPQAIDTILDDKNFDNQELTIDKVQGSKAIIYSRNKTPVMFTPDPKPPLVIFPSLYLLFKVSELSTLRFYLKQGVEQYIFKGADLMWPGIKSVNMPEWKQNSVAVVYALNQSAPESSDEQSLYVPVAVGRTIQNSIPEGLKGRAIEVEHYLYDELWNMGNKKIPEQIKMESTDASLPQEEESKTETKESLDNGKELQEEEKKSQEELKEEETIPEIPQEEMDARIVEAFMRCLIEGVKETDLPMEPSDFQKDYLSLYTADEFKLDLRLSSFKRIGKLLEVMSKKGLITYQELKGVGHKQITGINRKHQDLVDFKPGYKLKKVKKQEVKPQTESSTDTYPKVQIDEVYALSKHFNALLRNVKDFPQKQYYTIKECRDLITQYTKEQELDKNCTKGSVKVDPILNQIMDKSQISANNEIKKNELFKNLDKHVIQHYQVTQLDEEQLIKDRSKVYKGQVPKVKIIAERVANKKQTSIKGLELYQIDYEELVSYLQQKCASSVTLQKIESSQNIKQECYTVKVQGNQIGQVEQILTEKYKVPQKYIESEDKVGGKGKKKK